MRIALILLSILAMIFIGSISWSLFSSESSWLPRKSWTIGQNVDTITMETWENQIKTDAKIEKLTTLVEELSRKNGTLTKTNTSTGTGTENIAILKLSGKFLALIMPSVTPSLIENNGIFDLHTFDQSSTYSSYEDAKIWLKMVATDLDYDTLIKNFRAMGPTVYSVNETKSFPFRSFYLNPPKSDTLVRLVVEFESQTIGLEIQKTKFNTLKDLLTGKANTIQTTPKKK